jgi:hypothetical protein
VSDGEHRIIAQKYQFHSTHINSVFASVPSSRAQSQRKSKLTQEQKQTLSINNVLQTDKALHIHRDYACLGSEIDFCSVYRCSLLNTEQQ